MSRVTISVPTYNRKDYCDKNLLIDGKNIGRVRLCIKKNVVARYGGVASGVKFK
jgi:hypothetical protein